MADKKRREHMKEKLLKAFWQLYGEYPLQQLQVKAVASLAGCNRCTFYQYFTDIYDLLDYAEDVLVSDMMQYLQAAVGDSDMEHCLQNAAQAYTEYGYYLNILLGPNGSPSFFKKYKQAMKPFLTKQFHLPEKHPMADLLCEYCVGAFLATVSYWQQQKQPISAEELASFLYTALRQGVFQYLSDGVH